MEVQGLVTLRLPQNDPTDEAPLPPISQSHDTHAESHTMTAQLLSPSHDRAPCEVTDGAIQVLAHNLANDGQASASTNAVSSAKANLSDAVQSRKDYLNTLMSTNRGAIGKQLDQSIRMTAESESVGSTVRNLNKDFDLQNVETTGLTDFLKQSAARSTSAQAQSTAASTLSALRDIQRRHESLSAVEDAVWSGRSADDVVLGTLLQVTGDASVETGKSTKVLTAIHNRFAILRSTVSDQLTRAWHGSVELSVSPGNATIVVRPSARLQLPTIPRVTVGNPPSALSTIPPAYRLGEIITVISRLGTLPALLHAFHAQLVRDIVEPLITAKKSKITMNDQEASTTLHVVSQSDQGPMDIVESLKVLLSFVTATICAPDVSTIPEVVSFMAHLQQDIFNRILSALLIPSVPSTSSLLPDWLQLVRQCSEWETQLTGSSDGVLGRFATEEAATRWVDKFRHSRLQRARELAFRSWWEASLVEVEIPQEPEQSKALKSKPPKPAVEDDDAGGWGFDDDVPESATIDEDESSGWDFDDSINAPQPIPARPKQPVREAKRLGKRVAPKSNGRGQHLSSSQSSSPSPPRVVSPPPVPKRTVTPPKRERDVYLVSKASDEVLKLPSEVVQEVDTMNSLKEQSFNNVVKRMLDVLTDELDFICVITPVAQKLQPNATTAAALQLGNSYDYIANRLDKEVTGSIWTARESCAQRFKAAGDMLRRSSLEENLAHLTALLDGTRHLVEMSHDVFFAQAEEAVTMAVSSVESVAADVQPILSPVQYQTFVGGLIESIATRMLDDIMALEDITEVESGRIGALLTRIEALDGLFHTQDVNVSTIAAHVPHWLKLCYANQILGANLVDITYLVDSGLLVDFKPTELSRLVQALFADSFKRTALLDKISSLGH